MIVLCMFDKELITMNKFPRSYCQMALDNVLEGINSTTATVNAPAGTTTAVLGGEQFVVTQEKQANGPVTISNGVASGDGLVHTVNVRRPGDKKPCASFTFR